jgi:hypothetical protein
VDKYQETKNKYKKEKVQKIEIYVPIGEKEKIQSYAKTKAKSTNAYILDLIKKDMGINE